MLTTGFVKRKRRKSAKSSGQPSVYSCQLKSVYVIKAVTSIGDVRAGKRATTRVAPAETGGAKGPAALRDLLQPTNCQFVLRWRFCGRNCHINTAPQTASLWRDRAMQVGGINSTIR